MQYISIKFPDSIANVPICYAIKLWLGILIDIP